MVVKPKFTVDWFSIHIPVWEEKVLPRLRAIKRPVYLEIGTHEGRSLCWMLDNVPNLIAHAIDPLEDKEFKIWKSNVGNRATLARMSSRENLSSCQQFSIAENQFNCIYIDGSHWAHDVLSDTIISWPFLKTGGIMIWDDYGWLADDDPIKGPKSAIDAFLTCYRTQYRVLHIGYQFLVEKI